MRDRWFQSFHVVGRPESGELRKAHHGPYDTEVTRLGGETFYEDHLLRFHGEGLWRVYELIYSRDRKQITEKVLDIAGLDGLAALWIDRGLVLSGRAKRAGVLRPFWSRDEVRLLKDWMDANDLPCTFDRYRLLFDYEQMRTLKRRLAPRVHYSMRASLAWVREKPELRLPEGYDATRRTLHSRA